MKHTLLTLALFVSLSAAFSQTFQWAKQLGGTAADNGRAVCTDASGNVLSAGYFTGTFDANPGSGVANLVAPAGINNGYFSKLDSNGNFIWGKALTTVVTGSSEIYGITTDAAGNVYITGGFTDTIDFDPGAGTAIASASPAGIFVCKYTSAGALTWAKTMVSTYLGNGFSICVDGAGNVITTGRFSGTADFDPGAGVHNLLTGGGGYGVFLQKLDGSGNYQWSFVINASGNDQGTCVKTDAANNIYICGSIASNNDFDPAAGNSVVFTKGNLDAFVAKYNSGGGYLWAKGFGSTTTDIAQGLVVDASQNVYFTGYFSSTFDANPDTAAAAVNNLVSAGNADVFLIKLNSNGSFGWAKQVGSTGIDVATGISLGAGATIYLSGYFEGTVDFDPSAATTSFTSFGLKDGFLLSLNGVGDLNWCKQMGGTGDDYNYATSATTGTLTSIYSTGTFTGTANFNPPATANLAAAGAADAFVHRMLYTCTYPTTPTVSSTVNSVCSGNPVTLSVATGNLNSGTNWQWYTGGCGATSAGSGTSITVSPTANTSYSVRGEGGCIVPGICGVKTISVTANVTPTISCTASQTSICAGASVTFTATATNGGTTPTYEWRKNGAIITGATSLTYTASSIANGDSFVVSMYSNAACASPTVVSAAYIRITVSPAVTPTIAISTTATTVCTGTSVAFTSTITNGGTTPTYQWKKNGTNITGATSPAYTLVAPANNDQISCVLTSNAGCVSSATATSNTITLTVNSAVAPTITVATTTTTVCAGTSVAFTSSITNGGTTPTYQWKKNGTNISGATAATYTLAAPVNNDQISCVLSSNSACASPLTATSNSVTLTINPSVVPTITVSAPQTTICAGGSLTFTAAITNGGTTPAYQWKKNGTNITGATSSTYTSNTLVNSDQISCELTSNANCAQPTVVTSSAVTVTVTSPVTPTITIATTQSTSCTGTLVTFTSSITNGGNSPAYQWKKNGTDISGANAATYSSAALVNNDQISCVLTSNAGCITAATGTSNTITVTVNGTVAPAISISTTTPTVCAGTGVSFTSAITNGGNAPAYQWKRNGTNIAGATSATYTLVTPANNDQISCVLTSNSACASPLTVTSNIVILTVTQPVAPTITISTPQTSVCAGSSVTFTSVVTNGGSTPQYEWKKNGVNIPGANAATYTTTTLVSGDEITCNFLSSASCVTSLTALSNAITVGVSTTAPAAITISTPQNTVCAGASVTFTSTIANGGNAPTYQWKKNGTNITGATSATYTGSGFVSNDQISCFLTSNSACASPNTATSNAITLTVSGAVVPTISIATPATTICAGTSVTFSTSVTNGGANPTYQWKKNGTDISGATASTFSSNTLTNNDQISCVLTSSAACASPLTATSNAVTMVVNPSVTPTISIAATQTTICQGTAVTFTATITNGGNAPTYQWKANGNNVTNGTSPTFTSSTLANNVQITCVLTSNAGCASPTTVTSNTINMVVNNAVLPSVTVTATQTTICAGNSVTFTANPVNGGTAPTYQWRVNGLDISGATGVTYTNSSLTNGSQVSCVLTSNAPCTSASSVSSISVQITVSSTVTPAISIVADTTTICQGGSVTLTATPTNGGSSPAYQWRKNGTAITGATAATYTASNVANQDVFTCVLTSSVSCAAPTTATSNAVTITVNPSLTASVTLNYTTDSVCNGESFTVSAVPVNGGQNPAYQWQLNGNDITGETGATYTSSALVNNDQLRVKMISAAACAAPSPATSPDLTITVVPVVVPSVTVSASQTTICTGTTVNFTATPVNGGSSPAYVWQLNGNTISGATGATYSSSALSNNDSVSCQLVSAALCASPGTVSSSSVTISTTTSATASVTVTASDTTICTGVEVLFTALPIEGGSAPLYQWIKNAVDISGANTVTYTTNQLSNNDQLSCRMTSNSTCVTQPVVTSPALGISVNALPDVSITTAGNTLSVAEAGTYQWLDCALNTVVSGATGQSFTPIATGNYAVLVVAGTGCSDTSACESVTVTSITEASINLLKAWPVPAYNVLNVELPDGLSVSTAEVYNALGQLTTVPFSMHGNQLQLSTTKLAAGLYVLQLKASGQTYTTRFVRAY